VQKHEADISYTGIINELRVWCRISVPVEISYHSFQSIELSNYILGDGPACVSADDGHFQHGGRA